MADKVSKEDLDLLEELGLDSTPEAVSSLSPRQQRIIAGFEEIERFVEEHGHVPHHGDDKDIFERLYAVRLDRIRESAECRELLSPNDPLKLLTTTTPELTGDDLSDSQLLDSLGVSSEPADDITKLVHVRPYVEVKAAEEVAQRNQCKDFEDYKPIFEQVQNELNSGLRLTRKYQDNAEVRQGDLFILDGQKLLVAEMGERFKSDYGRPDSRLRVIFDNGTESDLLLRSLQRALNKDKSSRRITESDSAPFFGTEEEEEDFPSGFIYILRSQSDHPFIRKNRDVIHKIGVTGGDVKARISNAKKDPTYLLAEVDIVATYKLSNINRKKLEALLQNVFHEARLDLMLKDRFDFPVAPREWFLVPVGAIEDAIAKITDGTLSKYRYNIKTAKLELKS